MNHLKRYSGFLILLAAAFIPLACSDGEQEGNDTSRLKTFSFIIKTPTTDSVATNTRTVGDPGTAVDEEDVWDRLTVIVTFFNEDATNTDGTKNSQKVFYKTISRSDFNSLSDYPGYEGYKVFEMNVPLGTAYLYGITYTKDAHDFETEVKACTDNAAVQALTISNDYASNIMDSRWSHFTSVATGFYTGEPTSEDYPYVPSLSNGIKPIEITENNESLKDKVRLLNLQRLAAKIDVQWDAADAYALGTNYTDVKVTDFTYTCGATDATDAGSGHLFPELNTEALNGFRKTTNTTEISKRNGREYLYMFPDGKSGGTLSFNVTTKVNNATDATNTYTYTMPTLNRARWYKCHFTVNGNSGNSTTEDLTINGATQTTGD